MAKQWLINNEVKFQKKITQSPSPMDFAIPGQNITLAKVTKIVLFTSQSPSPIDLAISGQNVSSP